MIQAITNNSPEVSTPDPSKVQQYINELAQLEAQLTSAAGQLVGLIDNLEEVLSKTTDPKVRADLKDEISAVANALSQVESQLNTAGQDSNTLKNNPTDAQMQQIADFLKSEGLPTSK